MLLLQTRRKTRKERKREGRKEGRKVGREGGVNQETFRKVRLELALEGSVWFGLPWIKEEGKTA